MIQKIENHSFTTRHYTVIYYETLYQTLEEACWHLGLKKSDQLPSDQLSSDQLNHSSQNTNKIIKKLRN